MSKHQDTSRSNGHEFRYFLVILFEDYEHGKKLFASGNGRNPLAQTGKKKGIQHFKPLAEL
jgi:hypothetical protein